MTVGSRLHGVVSGSDDKDEMGVFIPPPDRLLGLTEQEHMVSRTAWERTGKGKSSPDQPRSEAGDIDLTMYSLRKYCKMAATGNPSILLLFFVTDKHIISSTPAGKRLQAAAPNFISRDAGKKFLGYLKSQKERLTGERGQKGVKRPELEEKYGFDTKFAYQALRLGLQGIELMQTGQMTLPMTPSQIMYLNRVREGGSTLTEVLRDIEGLDAQLKSAYDKSPLPEHPNYAAIDKFLVAEHLHRWQRQEV